VESECEGTNRQIFTLEERALRYTAGLKQLESCRDSCRKLDILTIYLLYIQEKILYAKEKYNCTVTKQLHITHEIIAIHNVELQNSKPSVPGCTLYNRLFNNVKQIGNNQFKKELKNLLIKGCYYSTEDCLNEEFCNIGYL
jgi:hypothetical protein